MRSLRHAFGIIAAVVASVIGAAAQEGRLPGGVVPLNYAIHLEPDIEGAKFSGRVAIELELKEAKRELVLNSLELKIAKATVGDAVLTATPDDAAQQLRLSGKELPAGRHTLVLEFSGKLSERPQGLYLTRYQRPDGNWDKALVTQMEPADARRMFPCWDEPGYRSVFQLTAIVPAKHTALFNMPIVSESPVKDGKREVVFGESPAMPSYLVAFVSSELEVLEDEVDGTKLRILATPGKREKMQYAMEATKKVLPWFNTYFGVKYPLPKLDQVSFPSVGAGGMENWGCIIYADHALLFDEKQSSQSTRERVFDIVAHEIAHQWFGDLVTMQWWDDLWLNEGFASWMATKASAHFNPTWKKWERAAGGREGAMRLDARATTHPIQQKVVTAGDALQVFDEITYQKGQALLRMLESWLGEDRFRAGLRGYFAKHAYGNTTTADLWRALAAETGEQVESVARGWTEQPGFPVVNVSGLGEGRVEFRQERFSVHQKEPKPLAWQIPMVLQPLAEGSKERATLLGDVPERAPVSLPVLANAGAMGYFRVNYTGQAWDELKPLVAGLPEVDRLAVLNDRWAMVQAEKARLADWLELAVKLKDDPSPLVGGHLVAALATLNDLSRGTDERPAIQAWARDFLAPRLKRIGWDAKAGEEPAMANHRADVLELMAKLGSTEVQAEARSRVLKYLDEPSSLSGDLRAVALRIAGSAAEHELWERLHALAKKTADSEQKYSLYGALVCAQSEPLALRALQASLTGELPAKTAARLVSRVAGEGEQPELAWKFARQHMAELFALCSAGDANEYMARLARHFSDEARAAELEELTKSSLPVEAAYDCAIAADEIRFKAAFKKRALGEFAKWFDAQGNGGR